MSTPSPRRAGFTLVELLIVVVIIGILATIAIPKFGTTKESSYLATMRNDLRNLASAQEGYVGDFGTYYGGAVPTASLIYNPSAGVTITLSDATASGWAAVASSPGRTTRTCALFVGSAAPVAPATVSGVIACD